MKWIGLIIANSCVLIGCSQSPTKSELTDTTSDKITVYQHTIKESSEKSKSLGSHGNGTLKHGKLMPFSGSNFTYFDTTSYVKSRAFVHDKVKKSVLAAYYACDTICPDYHFTLMECSNQHGGKIWPHRTHQNGLSIDFAMPLQKSKKQYRGLDLTGANHYLMDFDENGVYLEDKKVSINFEIVCQHILALEQACRENGLKIKKVIIKTDLKDDLYASPSGQKIKESGIYVVKKLEPLINQLHDDHYHIDFELLK
ncbi:MAG: penicillin-insensitive murein endopeptidase [Flavobacteriales bacterium]|nr:penicillin-insensitive murein endopeptidase [Flavobacteriales bacterium]